MTKLKNGGFRARKEFLEALDAHIKKQGFTGSRNDYIIEALNQRISAEDGTLPGAKAPHGVRSDALPDGWRSRLYRDRYQLIATFEDGEFIFHHFHDAKPTTEKPFGTLRAETPYPLEVTIYCPSTLKVSDVQKAIQLELMTVDWQHLFDRE